MARTIKVTMMRSGIGRPAYFSQVLKGMGLTRRHQTVELPDTPETRGMIRKVSHMVVIEE